MTEKYSEHPAMFKNHPVGFICSVLLIPAFGIGILILLYWFIAIRGTKLTITDTDLLFEKGILSKERSEVNIKSIRTTKVKQSLFNRVFGTGTIEIYTAGDNPEIIAPGMPDPHAVRDLIKNLQPA